MNDKTKSWVYPTFWIVLFVAAIVVITLLVQQSWDKPEVIEEPVGGVNIANEYHSSSTSLMGDAATKHLRKFVTLKTGQSTLGSVVVVSTTASTLRLMNATTTPGSYIGQPSSTLVTIPASIGVGVYAFDIIAPYGIVVDFGAGFGAEYVITYR